VLSLADVVAAASRIRAFVARTPLERSAALSRAAQADVWLKLECFQSTGSFKLRGALNALLTLPAEARQAGVLTVSAGNHGLGVARAASLLGVPATVVVPATAAPIKVDALRRTTAHLVLEGSTYDEAERAGRAMAQQQGLHFVSPYNDQAVVAGGGTLALEVLEDLPSTRCFVVPAGGGGLISGVGLAAHAVDANVAVRGAQSTASPALHAALAADHLVEVRVTDSLADGLAGNVEPGSLTFDLVRRHVADIALVDEQHIARGMRWLLEHEHVLVEGSAAVGVAALLENTLRVADVDGPIVVILTGRNVSPAVVRHHVLGPLS
jgi:threonine dehydratase